MKKILTILLLAVSLTAFAGQPAIAFDTTSHDFGSIREESGAVSCTFNFKNTGDSPLVILSASASCGCTRPTYPVRPVQPGETGEIKVKYIPAGRPGEFNKEVTVKTNVPKNKKLKLRISGVVIPEKK